MFCCIIVFVIVLIAAFAAFATGTFVATREQFQLGYYDPNLYASEITRNV